MEAISLMQQELTQVGDKEADKNVSLLLICGEINFEVMSNIISLINAKLKLIKVSNSIVTRTKLLSTEIIQNLFKHGSKKNTNNCFFAIKYNEHHQELILSSGNLVESSNIMELSSKLNSYKALSQDEIRELYLDKLRNSVITGNDSAGLGLLTLFHRSKGLVSFKFNKLNDEENYLVIGVKYKVK